jgi:glucokinase
MTHKALGIDLGGTTVKAGIVSGDGSIVAQISLPSLADKGPETVADQIVKSIYEVIGNEDLSSYTGVGVATPGILDPEGITVKAPPNFADWDEYRLGEAIAARLKYPLPIKVENDANAAAIAESKFGAGVGHDNFLFVIWGTGVGGGIIMDGKIYHGPHGGAGEFGHVSIDYKGPQCNCGNIGCVESYVGQRYLSQRAVKYLKLHTDSLVWRLVGNDPEAIEPKILAEAADRGDIYAREIMEEAGELLGVAIASFMNLMNYDFAIVGGGISAAGDLVFEPMNRRLKAAVMAPLRPIAKVIPAKLGNSAGILGAAGMVL